MSTKMTVVVGAAVVAAMSLAAQEKPVERLQRASLRAVAADGSATNVAPAQGVEKAVERMQRRSLAAMAAEMPMMRMHGAAFQPEAGVDYRAMAMKLDGEANALAKESAMHRMMAERFELSGAGQEMKHPMAGNTAGHCRYMADELGRRSAEARQMTERYMAGQ